MINHIYILLTIVLTVYGQIIIKWQVKNAGSFPILGIEKAEFLLKILLNPWVISSFTCAFYPTQGIRGNYYNLASQDGVNQLTFSISPNLESLLIGEKNYSFDHITILDGKKQLKPFSHLHIKTSNGSSLMRLQTGSSVDNVSSILELFIP